MQILLSSDDINHLIESVLLPSLDRTSNIPRDVNVSSIFLPNDRARQFVRIEIDDERAVGFGDET